MIVEREDRLFLLTLIYNGMNQQIINKQKKKIEETSILINTSNFLLPDYSFSFLNSFFRSFGLSLLLDFDTSQLIFML